jgi:hypothetical protein
VIVSAEAGKPRLDRVLPSLPAPGQILALQGSGFAPEALVVFPGEDGYELVATPTSVTNSRIEVPYPWEAVDGPILVRNGSIGGNSLAVRTLFQPIPELFPAASATAQGTPLKFVVHFRSAQLSLAGFQWTVWNAQRPLEDFTGDQEVGTATFRIGDRVTQELSVRVVGASAERLALQLFDDDGDDVGTLDVTPAEGTVAGLSFEYAPTPSVTSPVVAPEGFRMEISLTGFRVQVGLDGSPGVSWAASIRSCPPGSGGVDSGLVVMRSR